jgi:hypothetical protein
MCGKAAALLDEFINPEGRMIMAQTREWSVMRALALLSVLCAAVLAAPAVPPQPAKTTLRQRI